MIGARRTPPGTGTGTAAPPGTDSGTPPRASGHRYRDIIGTGTSPPPGTGTFRDIDPGTPPGIGALWDIGTGTHRDAPGHRLRDTPEHRDAPEHRDSSSSPEKQPRDPVPPPFFPPLLHPQPRATAAQRPWSGTGTSRTGTGATPGTGTEKKNPGTGTETPLRAGIGASPSSGTEAAPGYRQRSPPRGTHRRAAMLPGAGPLAFLLRCLLLLFASESRARARK